MSTCIGNPVTSVTRGNSLRLHTVYEVPATHEALDDAMSIMLIFIA